MSVHLLSVLGRTQPTHLRDAGIQQMPSPQDMSITATRSRDMQHYADEREYTQPLDGTQTVDTRRGNPVDANNTRHKASELRLRCDDHGQRVRVHLHGGQV